MTCTRCGDATERKVRIEMASSDQGLRIGSWALCKSCEIYVWALIQIYAQGHGREVEAND